MSSLAFQERLSDFFNSKNPPFLFLGSGFSRRYLGLGNFRELLEAISQNGFRDFKYYESKSDGMLPRAAEHMATDFSEIVWNDTRLAEFIAAHKDNFATKHSAFKILIADYIQQQLGNHTEIAKTEIPLLKRANIDAIITTNYDNLIESIFPNYKKYIGQDDLLSSNPQMVGEIYKIHGCIASPNSIIITESDYANFEDKNKYLAAKLATAFVERPIVFIGYSIGDSNIQNIIQSIAGCSEKVRERIQGNIFFVNRAKGADDTIEQSTLTIGTLSVGYTKVSTDDFGKIYIAMSANRRRIPANYLRLCKEQLYEIALHNSPKERIRVLSPDELEENKDVEFIVGVGLYSADGLGYATFSQDMALELAIAEHVGIDPHKFITISAPNLLKRTRYIPIHCHLTALGITTKDTFDSSNLPHGDLAKAINLDRDSYKPQKPYQRMFSALGISKFSELLSVPNITNAQILLMGTMVNPDMIREEQSTVISYLHEAISGALDINKSYKSNIGKLICYYDKCVFGWF